MGGRLATTVAKELLNGQRVVCVRTEKINISGSLYRNKTKYLEFKRKRMNTNPKKGPYHYRCPHKMFWRVVRGMIPHKTARGQMALTRLKSYDGMTHHRKYCVLGDLAHEMGWKHKALIERLAAKRSVKQKAHYAKKVAALKAKKAAIKSVAGKLDKAVLEPVGL